MSAHHKNKYTLIGAITVQEAATIHALYLEKTDGEIGEMIGRPWYHIKNYRRSKNLVKPQGNREGWNKDRVPSTKPKKAKVGEGFCALTQDFLGRRFA